MIKIPIYFWARIRWAGHEIEFIHDKVYLEDTDDIKDFSISDFLHATYPEPVNFINVPVTGTHILLGVGYDL